ncbi:MAG: SulP family inorganic anion transporter [Alphaproteobacteria bacterium]|nr:SulP family inorganic anion transporter [Alphaproteobacteria bacterium]
MNISKRIKGDIYGGITAGIISLPLALGFGAVSGLGAAAGLYTAIILSIMATVFGSTRTQICGPTGPMTVVVAAMVAAYMDNLAIVFAITALAGIFQIIFGLTKLGKVIKVIPKSVISGFISGIGCITVLLQLAPFLGLPFRGGAIDTIRYLSTFPAANLQGVLLGVLAFTIVAFLPKQLVKVIPFSLIALVAGTLASIVLRFDVPTIGVIQNGMPEIRVVSIDLDKLLYIIPLALSIAVLSSIDTLMTSLVVDKKLNTRHNSNKDLIGIGLGNALAGVFGGFAGSNSTVPTMANIKFGGTTRFSGIASTSTLILILLFLAPVVGVIPLAVLAGILVRIGIGVIDWRFLKEILKGKQRAQDALSMLAVLIITIFGNLIVGVVAGTLLYYLIRCARYFIIHRRRIYRRLAQDAYVQSDIL